MDVKVFKEDKWSVWNPTHEDNVPYACHNECPRDRSDDFDARWSWFKADDCGECFGCRIKVPEHIQGLVILLTTW